MTLRAAHALTSIKGNDLSAIDSALRNLVVVAGARKEIDEDVVAEVTGSGGNYGPFAFGEAVYGRDVPRAFAIARNAFREGMEDRQGRKVRDGSYVAGRLLWSVTYRLKDIYRASAALAAGASEKEVEKASGKRGVIATRLVRQARAFETEELLGHWVLVAEAEAELRTSTPREAVIERLIPLLTETPA
jgi:hypothetical protein